MLTACGGLNGDDGTGNVTITLPNVSAAPSANAKAVGRSISPDAIAGLRRDTVRYRVHMNNRVLEGTGGNFSANFPVGLKVDVYVECIGSGGNVIIRTDVKTIVVRSRQNSVDINLQTDGTVVGQPQPSAPQPVTGQVTYYVGNANATDGVMPPTDGTTYTAGDEVTVSAAPSWAYGMFSHWQADDATLKNETTGATNGQFSAGEKFKMPASGVVLTAVYDATKYTIKFSTSGGPASVTPATPDMEFTMEAANPNQTFASVSGAGYGFGGWEYNGKSYADIDAVRSDMRAGNNLFPANNEITLAAKWTVNSYGITYSAGSGVTAISNTMPADVASQGYNTTVTITTTPKRHGYTFNGWDSSVSGTTVTQSGSNYSFTMPASAITLTAKWTEMTELNVSASGNNTTGDGSSANPFSTVQNAITVAKTLTGTNLTIKVNGTVEVSEGITFDTTGKTITINGSSNGMIKRGSGLTDVPITVSQGEVNFENIILDGNKTVVTNATSPLVLISGGTVSITSNATIQNNKNSSSNGGGVRISSGVLNIAGTITENEVAGRANYAGESSGGGVYASGGTVNFINGIVSKNKGINGAGLYISTGVTLTGSGTVTENESTDNGAGGIHLGSGFTLTNFTITNNISAGGGGGIRGGTGTITLSGNTNISNNRASNGGAIFMNGVGSGNSTVIIDSANVVVKDNVISSGSSGSKNGFVCDKVINDVGADIQND